MGVNPSSKRKRSKIDKKWENNSLHPSLWLKANKLQYLSAYSASRSLGKSHQHLSWKCLCIDKPQITKTKVTTCNGGIWCKSKRVKNHYRRSLLIKSYILHALSVQSRHHCWRVAWTQPLQRVSSICPTIILTMQPRFCLERTTLRSSLMKPKQRLSGKSSNGRRLSVGPRGTKLCFSIRT